MIAYFGYGSNINLVSLRAKGVEPFSSRRAILRGWSLVFNVKHWFHHEGGVGNITPSTDPDAYVEGMVHECSADHLAALDKMEAYGWGYDRIHVDAETETGPMRAYAYVGMPGFLDDTCLPTNRYLNIIIRGAEAAGLSESYIDRLRNHPRHLPAEYPDFVFPNGKEGSWYNAESLAQHPHLTAVAGAVFDMRGSRSQLAGLFDLFGGKDTTLFHLKRLDSSDGTESIDDIRNSRISHEGRKYLNAYLHEFNREFTYAGRYRYD